MKTFLKIAAACLPMVVLSPLAITPARAQVSFGADIHIGDAPPPQEVIVDAPPPPQREVIVERPYPEAIWVPGYYNAYHVWAPGFWRRPHYMERGREFRGREYAHRDFDRGHEREFMRRESDHGRGGHEGGGGHEQGGGRGRGR